MKLIPTDREAEYAFRKWSKSVFFPQMYRNIDRIGYNKAKMALRDGYSWTRYDGYPAVVSSSKEWYVIIRKSESGEVYADLMRGVKEMGDGILDKIDKLLSESDRVDDASVYSVGNPRYSKADYRGSRPAQFMRWWENFRPGDRVDVVFGEDSIHILGSNAEGNFAGVTKEFIIEDPAEVEKFKSDEGYFWNFV